MLALPFKLLLGAYAALLLAVALAACVVFWILEFINDTFRSPPDDNEHTRLQRGIPQTQPRQNAGDASPLEIGAP